MKKIILLFTISCFLFHFANAQINKGAVLLGTDFNLGSRTSTGNSVETTDRYGYINISLGKAFKNNNVIGINFSYTSSKNQLPDNQNYSIIDLRRTSAGIFYRKYKPLSKHFLIYGETGVGYFSSKQEASSNTINNNFPNEKTWGFNGYFSAGLSYQICNKIQFNVSVPLVNANYSHTNTTSSGTSTTSNGYAIGTQINGQIYSWFQYGFRFIF